MINIAMSVVFEGSALYLKNKLGISILTIGIMEGVVETISYIIRIFSGVFSDYIARRKPIIICGFILLTFSKILLYFSNTFLHVFYARTIDSLGHGIQTSPREAIISENANGKNIGKCYGFKQSVSVLGYTIGGILGSFVLFITNNNFNIMFLISSIPALLGIFVLTIYVREPKKSISNANKFSIKSITKLDKIFWIIIINIFFMMLGRCSEIYFAIYACEKLSLNLSCGPTITMTYNIVSIIIAYITGINLDRYNKFYIFGFCILFLLISHILFFISSNLIMFYVGICLWGIHMGMTHITIATIINKFSGSNIKATCFGIYYSTIALSTFIATTISGFIANYNQNLIFLYGIVMSILSLCLFILSMKFFIIPQNLKYND